MPPQLTFDTFRVDPTDLNTLPKPLRALWLDSTGDWEAAHLAVQDDESPEAAWVHAYLHRKEGDVSNAEHWYVRASQPTCTDSLEVEWRNIAQSLLEASKSSPA